jgi:hypothetical protein
VLALGSRCPWGHAGRDDGRALVNPDLFVRPMSSIREVVVESCRRLVGSSAEVRWNVAGEHAYQHFRIIPLPEVPPARRSGWRVAYRNVVPYCEGGAFQGLVEAFDLVLGLRVVGVAVLLGDVEARE